MTFKASPQTRWSIIGIVLAVASMLAYMRWLPHTSVSPKGPAALSPFGSRRPSTEQARLSGPHIVSNKANNLGLASYLHSYEKLKNPGILVVPFVDPPQYLMIGGGLTIYEETHYSNNTMIGRACACYLHTPLDLAESRTLFRCEEDLMPLDTPAPEGSPLQLCTAFAAFNYMVTTADDTRMWLTNEGVPMLIYFSSMPNHCRGMSIIDARAVVPGLDEMMRWAGFNEPIRYSEPFRLIRAGQGEIEKNWSPINHVDGEFAFYTWLTPPQVVAQVSSNLQDPLQLISPYAPNEEDNCILALTPPDVSSGSYHLGTPFLRVKLCSSTDCPRDAREVAFGIFHRKFANKMFYDARVIVVDAKAPYPPISISKSLSFAGISARELAFIHGLVWAKPRFENGQLIGYLDDPILISIGINDSEGALTETTVQELLASQMTCPDVR